MEVYMHAHLVAQKIEELVGYVNGRSDVTVTDACYCLYRAYCMKTGRCRMEESPVESIAAKEEGKWIHSLIQRMLRGVPEKRLCLRGVCGRADVVLGDDVVLEIKTSMQGRIERYVELKPWAVCQLAFYMKAAGAKKGLLVLVDRRELRLSGALLLDAEEDRELIDRCTDFIVERVNRLREAIEKGEPPPPEPGHWCRWCPVRDCGVLGRVEPFRFVSDYILRRLRGSRDIRSYILAPGGGE